MDYFEYAMHSKHRHNPEKCECDYCRLLREEQEEDKNGRINQD